MRLALPVSVALLASLVGCTLSGNEQSSSSDTRPPVSSIGPGEGKSSGGGGDYTGAPTTGSGGGTSGTPVGGGTSPQAGTLTAGAWDDNANFDFYLSYVDKQATLAGAPIVARADRMRIEVSDGVGGAIGNATITVKSGDKVVFTGPTTSDGHLDFYPTWASVPAKASLSIEAAQGSVKGTATALAGDKTVSLALTGAAPALPNALDVALVIDTTGSMGDEITYLRTEVAAIAKGVSARWPAASQRWSVVAYKDVGDEYVVKTSPFLSDPAAIQAQIAGLSADGGGDYPESPDQALATASTLDWRSGNVARMVFWIADAPHHPGKEGSIVKALETFRQKGVHLYPIAASGADELTELTMRSSAQLTMGRYLFLTDDSGVGGTHKEPTVPCYFVTKLDNAMTRMIAAELTGAYVAPTPTEVLRTGGDPKDGRCTLSDGQQVVIY